MKAQKISIEGRGRSDGTHRTILYFGMAITVIGLIMSLFEYFREIKIIYDVGVFGTFVAVGIILIIISQLSWVSYSKENEIVKDTKKLEERELGSKELEKITDLEVNEID